MNKPLIGITGSRHVMETHAAAPSLLAVVSSDDYAQGVEAAGGCPVIVPYLTDDATVQTLANLMDGLILAGGEDVHPGLWGDQPRHGLGSVVPERDDLEMALIRRMLALQKPILGICRGIQILNVALGGSLYQDLPREWRGKIQHRQRARRDFLSHGVQLAEHSRLARLVGGTAIRCNTFHHQAVRELGEHLVAVGWDDEGLVEAVEHETLPFVVGVQWHPENLWRKHPEHLALFRGLVEAAAIHSSGTVSQPSESL
ncbi:gamma-glutamyl-gamma-aminobutyrate hydrolase [Alicyclobacillus contaminans]|uniref:gamma-glutamyl-gamma-aminobutyrate hydrolase family protein n=1 Tax=Alicyclobacillus contaminans TaxID=392016 RepID=UPI0004266EAF|nr:gamma-glutamyl-gamma-aminobutyrate hydrolase family protein [Alicyclobacillus contaminans]GMA51147.1 gamma-glutamyl-gamma-aminobutyrate hydrolase [Alicyclobacillus contaminans]